MRNRSGLQLLLFVPVTLGIGLGAPLLYGLATSGSRRAPYAHPHLTAGGVPDWHTSWTSELQSISQVQDDGFGALVGRKLAELAMGYID
jgi:hypothetical protein